MGFANQFRSEETCDAEQLIAFQPNDGTHREGNLFEANFSQKSNVETDVSSAGKVIFWRKHQIFGQF